MTTLGGAVKTLVPKVARELNSVLFAKLSDVVLKTSRHLKAAACLPPSHLLLQLICLIPCLILNEKATLTKLQETIF